MKKDVHKVKKNARRRLLLWLIAGIALIAVALGAVGVSMAYKSYAGRDVRIYIAPDVSENGLRQMLVDSLGEEYGATLYRIWSWRSGDITKAAGSYVISTGDRAWSVANRLKAGAQTPIKVTFNNIRSIEELASRLSPRFIFDPEDFMAACDSILPSRGYGREQYAAAFVPDTYEMYVTDDAAKVVGRLADERDRFWTDSRRAKAMKLGLTPVEVATLASIVEEESAKNDERPIIARLYLNRLDKRMKLQADPTVKFAVGDFTLRRILESHLATDSPYNTYKNQGLPPGPIRIAEKSTIDAVLDAPQHNYLYMCAREDFSGYHNFTDNYDAHLANARRYQAALDRHGIK